MKWELKQTNLWIAKSNSPICTSTREIKKEILKILKKIWSKKVLLKQDLKTNSKIFKMNSESSLLIWIKKSRVLEVLKVKLRRKKRRSKKINRKSESLKVRRHLLKMIFVGFRMNWHELKIRKNRYKTTK